MNNEPPPQETKHPLPPFAPTVRSGDFVFVSGQASTDEHGAIVSDTFEGEMRRSLDNLRRVLARVACGLDDVVQVRAYVRDAKDLPDYNRLYRDYFAEPFPARTTLTGCLSQIRFEIEAVARTRDER